MRWRWLIGWMLIFVLTGCQNVELYSNLSEKEGNEILAVLLSHQIPASKSRTKEFVKITVAKDDVAAAIETLRRYGYPRDHFTHLGDIFQKQGLISSPLEERVRYTFGLSQMIAETLNQIDGVLSARVLIVLPEDSQFGKTTQPASASVFIKYLPGLGVEDAIPKIKMIVQNSVNGLNYDKISVVLFPAREAPRSPVTPPTLEKKIDTVFSMERFLPMILGGLLLLAMGGNGYLFWRMRRRKAVNG
ncbi:MAG: type III secretion inner membrane ring lipoprotein SctJ [Candidatus Contendobacter sp.]|nr:type III secretion inner membrane ring lipoprotein SctJ [Candidatus Contendobacter sp.]